MKTKLKEFYAVGMVYCPFVFGGDVWQPHKYKVNGESLTIGKYKCFSFYNPVSNTFHVHHLKTGGMLGEGKTLEEAIKIVRKNIKITPDLDEQMNKIGTPDGKKEIEAEKFWRMAKD